MDSYKDQLSVGTFGFSYLIAAATEGQFKLQISRDLEEVLEKIWDARTTGHDGPAGHNQGCAWGVTCPPKIRSPIREKEEVMKGRKGFVVMAVVAFSVLLMSLPFSAAAWTWNDWDGHHKRSVTYSSPQDFALYFWMEKFQGGRPGAQGNVLFAAGEGFIFQNAVLESVSSLGDGRYQTTYVGGELFLNSDGPWLNRGKLRATDIKATNVSQYAPDFATLTYKLTFDGAFDNDPDLCFSVTADYTGSPNFGLDPSNPIYQKGSVSSTDAFTATITLYHCW